jgi:hypothetical protein
MLLPSGRSSANGLSQLELAPPAGLRRSRASRSKHASMVIPSPRRILSDGEHKEEFLIWTPQRRLLDDGLRNQDLLYESHKEEIITLQYFHTYNTITILPHNCLCSITILLQCFFITTNSILQQLYLYKNITI